MIKWIVTYLFLLATILVNGQVDLAVQKAHSEEIVQLEFSNSGRYLASMSSNNEFVIWDIFYEKSISSFDISLIEQIEGFKFSEDETQLKVKTRRTTFFYSIAKESFQQYTNSDTVYRNKEWQFDNENNYKISLDKGRIRKQKRSKKTAKYKIAINYTNLGFTAFDFSTQANLIIGVAQTERVYVYNYQNGRKEKELKAHLSAVNDVRFSRDGKWFATAGKDRSIIIWNAETLKIKTRLSSDVFRKKTVTFNHSGDVIYVGDELGYIYSIDLTGAFPKIDVNQYNYHSVNKIVPYYSPERVGYFVASADNHVYFTDDLTKDKSRKNRYAFRAHTSLKAKKLLLQNVFNVYQESHGKISLIEFSPNKQSMIYSGETDMPGIAHANVESKKINRVYNYYDQVQWKDIGFINNKEFIAIHDSSDVLYYWKIDQNKIEIKTDTLPFVIEDFEVLGEDKVWLNTKHYGQYVYNVKTRIPEKKMTITANEVFLRGDYIVLETPSNALLFYDLKSDNEYYRFVGHKENVTDVNLRPQGDLFVSSSDDGTIRLWHLDEKKPLVSILPFKNKEFIFITNNNYYLMTKGAMEEIGFKVDGNYFYPEQFDLKYNRPDLVLDKMGFSKDLLIEAYHKAYLKRLKKMNFTEEQLSAEFHLPEVAIMNYRELPTKTSADSIKLRLKFEDTKFKLDRINIWVNGVAVYGINGIDVRNKDTRLIEEDVYVNLASGKNKIEVSVLNQTGAESYKSTVEIENTNSSGTPDLYIATLGISKHQQSKYDLEYADKDAKDVATAFTRNGYFKEVKTITLTNEEVVIDNLMQLKEFLLQAKINDVVMVFIAGHGVLNEDFDYFFATYDMNFDEPDQRGIPYEAIEKLLDGIPALKKLLFIDTCHSGELDKDEIEEGGDVEEQGDIIFRSVGQAVREKENPLGLQNVNELMKSLFTDLRKGTGATVISSSGGTEYAIEGNAFNNGLFTYCLLNGLTSRDADLNNDKKIVVSELQIYVQREVNRLSKGKQTPTSRIQNNELDYRIW